MISLGERHDAHRVVLMDHQVRQRRRQADRVVELRQLLPIRVGHRLAQIHRQIAGDVRLGLELLDVVLVGLGIHEPIDIVRIVAGRVLAMLAELNRKAMKRAGVQPVQKPLHDELSAQIKPRNLPDDFRLQVFFDGGHGARVCDSRQ